MKVYKDIDLQSMIQALFGAHDFRSTQKEVGEMRQNGKESSPGWISEQITTVGNWGCHTLGTLGRL